MGNPTYPHPRCPLHAQGPRIAVDAWLLGIATCSMISQTSGASGPVSEDLQRVHRPAAGWLYVGLCQKTT